MNLILPETYETLCQPLFDCLPFDEAMQALVVTDGPGPAEAVQIVEQIVQDPAMQDRPALVAGLWLYVDDLERSHDASQSLETPTGSYWHGIMHRREGDFSNSKYWFRKAGLHPAMQRIDLTGGGAGSGTDVARYDPFRFVDQLEKAHSRGDSDDPALISAQNKEWQALFNWCAERK
jgi:hypothetical protein